MTNCNSGRGVLMAFVTMVVVALQPIQALQLSTFVRAYDTHHHHHHSSPPPPPFTRLFLNPKSFSSCAMDIHISDTTTTTDTTTDNNNEDGSNNSNEDVPQLISSSDVTTPEESISTESQITNDNSPSSTSPTTPSSSTPSMTSSSSSSPLESFDEEIASLIDKEDKRQRLGLELIASENFVTPAVREAVGSILTNKYSEGNIGKRYYGGNEYIDQIESICIQRALSLYNLSPNKWGVNVQPYSGSPANFAVYTALLQPHDRIMGLDLPSGGHLTHGFQTLKRKVSATSVYFESMPYVVNEQTGLIDYKDLEYRAKMFLPKLLIAGASAYPREWDYKRMKEIADSVGAIFMVDMAHVAGLVAGQCVSSPFEYADVVTSTTHKTLRGPRSGIIFAKKEYMDKIDTAVFPSLQGGPHNHQIAAVAVALKEASQPSFSTYTRSIISNAQALAQGLINRGHTIATGGTDNHLLLWDVRNNKGNKGEEGQRLNQLLTGNKVEKVLELVSITTNKNSLPGDVSAINPGGVRLGTPALTSRGLTEVDFEIVAEFLDRGYQLAVEAQEITLEEMKAAAAVLISDSQDEYKGSENTPKKKKTKVLLKDFMRVLKHNTYMMDKVEELKSEVEEFASRFPMPGDDCN